MKHDSTQKDKLIKRLRYLWTWELFDSFFLPAVVVFAAVRLQKSVGFFAIYAMGLVTWILWQGAAYWGLKLRAVKENSEIEAKYLRWFGRFKGINWFLIGLLPLLLIGKGLMGDLFTSALDLTTGLGFYALAVLEQINYYYYQLMYDCTSDWRYLMTHKRLKRSKLSREMK